MIVALGVPGNFLLCILSSIGEGEELAHHDALGAEPEAHHAAQRGEERANGYYS